MFPALYIWLKMYGEAEVRLRAATLIGKIDNLLPRRLEFGIVFRKGREPGRLH
jgi:hypothetical protein